MDITLSGKFEKIIVEVLKNKTKSKEELFEVFNGVLNKVSKKYGDNKMSKTKTNCRKRKRDIICRPALMISDSSDNEEDNN